jgi:hypothetical protein
MQLIMENWRNYNVNIESEFNLINEINTMAYNTYGLQPSEFMNYQEQAHVINEIGFDACNDDAVHAMIVCGLLKNNNGEETVLNEQIMAVIATLRGAWNATKFFEFMNSLVGMAAKAVGGMRFNKAVKELKANLAQQCSAKFNVNVDSEWYMLTGAKKKYGPFPTTKMVDLMNAGEIPPEGLVWTDGFEDWQPASDTFEPYQKCTTFKQPLPPEIEELKNSQVSKVTETIKNMFAKIKEKFHKLIAYAAAVVVYKTLKPTEEQQMAAAHVAETILVFVSSGVSLYIIGVGLVIGSPWWQIILGAIFAGFEIYSAYKKLKVIGETLPRTEEEAKEVLKKQKKDAADAAIKEIEALQAQAA